MYHPLKSRSGVSLSFCEGIMPRRTVPRRRRRESYPRYAGDISRMSRDFNRTTLGMVGIGAVTSLGVGIMGSIPKV